MGPLFSLISLLDGVRALRHVIEDVDSREPTSIYCMHMRLLQYILSFDDKPLLIFRPSTDTRLPWRTQPSGMDQYHGLSVHVNTAIHLVHLLSFHARNNHFDMMTLPSSLNYAFELSFRKMFMYTFLSNFLP